MPEFVPGVDLARGLYKEVVRPLLDDAFSGISHSAALIGPGSEVLGFDTERSTDREWGPRLLLFVDPADAARAGEVVEMLSHRLPTSYRGWSTNFGPPDAAGARPRLGVEQGPVSHRVEVHTPGAWFEGTLGFDPAAGVDVDDWLATPAQLLLMVTSGEVFHDGLDALERRRAALAWYPHDLWLYVLGCQWRRVAQEEAFVGRAGEVGDDLGSRVVAARVARDLMRCCFLLERRYPPYAKWLGRAFGALECASVVGPHLVRALSANVWQRREAELGAAAERVGELHNRLGITEPIDTSLRPLHNRPFLVLDAMRFADACFAVVTDPVVRALPSGIGAIDQWVDNSDLLASAARSRAAFMALRQLREVEHRA